MVTEEENEEEGWMADGTSGWGGGNSLSSKSRDSVNHARGIVNIGTLNIEMGHRQDLQGWRKGILNFLSFLFSLSLSVFRKYINSIWNSKTPFSVSFSSRDTSISFVLNRSRGIGISRCSYGEEGWGKGSHKYNLDSSDHMPLESRPFFFPGRRFMAGFPYCSVSKYQDREVFGCILKSGKSVDPWKLVGEDYFNEKVKNLSSNSRLSNFIRSIFI